jgi:hypothetical protein
MILPANPMWTVARRFARHAPFAVQLKRRRNLARDLPPLDRGRCGRRAVDGLTGRDRGGDQSPSTRCSSSSSCSRDAQRERVIGHPLDLAHDEGKHVGKQRGRGAPNASSSTLAALMRLRTPARSWPSAVTRPALRASR